METRETVTVLSNSVEQLSHLLPDTVLQRLTALETQLLGEFNAASAENTALRQQLLIQSDELNLLCRLLVSFLSDGETVDPDGYGC